MHSSVFIVSDQGRRGITPANICTAITNLQPLALRLQRDGLIAIPGGSLKNRLRLEFKKRLTEQAAEDKTAPGARCCKFWT